MATIKAIEGRTVHQIQSGQVIVDLCSVVKELVENGLDAGAKRIEVRFKNQGLESVEVQDDGDGISPNNYETLALKHYTSKLSSYSDLTTLQTFGFRGEALSSLCALSNFSVITCMAVDAPKGTKLDFEVSGRLKDKSVVAAQKGTTVSVENLFNNLPVRRRELERNIKREWNRVMSLLGQYACIQTDIKFSVTQQVGKGKKTVLFSTKGNQSTRDNIVNVFGAKTLTALVTLDLKLELEPTSTTNQKWSTQDDRHSKEIRIKGHISRPASGEGRQTPDRQMFFVNTRPCTLPQVAKAFNEVYKSYNASQSPFIFADIELDTHLYDVNVSPDKRTILLHDQTLMLENLKTALTELFESQDYTVPVSQLPAQKQVPYKQLTLNRQNTAVSSSEGPSQDTVKGRVESTDGEESEEDGSSVNTEQRFEEEQSQGSPRGTDKIDAVQKESKAPSTESSKLMSNWVSRNSETRTGPNQADQSEPRVDPQGFSKSKRNLLANFKKQSEQVQTSDEPSDIPKNSAITTQMKENASSPQLDQRVIDFNRRMTELQAPLELADSADVDENNEEEPIPTLSSPAKPPPSIADRFSSRARLQRPPIEIATITIGDETITSSIGNPSPKRVRIDAINDRDRAATKAGGERASLPSFGSRLSQRFAAAGTAPHSSSDVEDNDEDEVADDQASSQIRQNSPGLFVDEDSQEDHTDRSQHADMQDYDENPSADSGSIEDEGEYLDEHEHKALEEARVEKVIEAAEESALVPSQENLTRIKSLLQSNKRQESTLDLVKTLNTSVSRIDEQVRTLSHALSFYHRPSDSAREEDEGLDSEKAEEKLSLTISKSDFAKMRVVGQFNLGFILATRASNKTIEDSSTSANDLFIIDQHASDEKYNFERLQATTIVQSQRLVYPKTLDLTALEEEIILENLSALENNGFIATVDESGGSPIGSRCQLISLPLSRETTFSLEDLDELLALLAEQPTGSVPRPSKVRKMFAMRACRSSIMIGKTLTQRQMGKVVRHLGELDKPWNCPHGRPTMRHLCGLGVWDELGWKEGEHLDEKPERTDWAAYLRQNSEGITSREVGEGSD